MDQNIPSDDERRFSIFCVSIDARWFSKFDICRRFFKWHFLSVLAFSVNSRVSFANFSVFLKKNCQKFWKMWKKWAKIENLSIFVPLFWRTMAKYPELKPLFNKSRNFTHQKIRETATPNSHDVNFKNWNWKNPSHLANLIHYAGHQNHSSSSQLGQSYLELCRQRSRLDTTPFKTFHQKSKRCHELWRPDEKSTLLESEWQRFDFWEIKL